MKVLTPFRLLVALPVVLVLRGVKTHSGGCGGVVLFLPVFCIMFLKNSQNGLRHLDIYMTEDLKRAAAVCVCLGQGKYWLPPHHPISSMIEITFRLRGSLGSFS